MLLVCAAGVLAAIALLSPPAAAPVASVAPVAPVALTSSTMRPLGSMFQDDRFLLYSSTATVARTLDALRALGVDRLRITVLWSTVAPAPRLTTPPLGFDAANPADYPARAWAPYDRVLELARARRIGVDFDLTAPGPLWAMGGGAPLAREADHFYPSAVQFGRFVLAAGRRYAGRYVPPGARTPIPRVGFWSIWNEPNQPGWLAPQRSSASGPAVVQSARLYRGYLDAAFAALRSSGHGRDTLLIGELAPEGQSGRGVSLPVAPLPFLRAVYCVGADDRPLVGEPAAALGCPGAGSPSAFVTAHPVLFDATGFAHHPYSFFLPPEHSVRDPSFVPLADLSRLERTLDRVFGAYAVRRRLPLYLTEYGYETNPPNPFRGVSPATQAAYLDQASYLAWRDPRVRTMSQFELYDSPPDTAYPRGSVGYWSTFQTGLVYLRGAPKPSLFTYRLPIYLPARTFAAGGKLTVWGMLRAAPNNTPQRAQIQWRRVDHNAAWRVLAVVSTRNRTGVLQVGVAPPGSGELRLVWVPSGGGPGAESRSVEVTAS